MKKLLSVLAATIFAASVRAQTIAVLGFESDNFNLGSRTATMSDLLTDKLVENEDLIIVERRLIDKVLEEIDFQQTTGYTDMATAKNIGKMLNADCIISGNVSVMDGKMTVTARTIDVETARILSKANMTCADWGEFNRKLPDFAQKLVSKIPMPNYFAGTWQGSSSETDDTYEIVLDEKNKCKVTLITYDEFGESAEYIGAGSWSYDSAKDIFRLDARLKSDFGSSKKLSWRNFARLDSSKKSFNYVIKDGKKQYRLTFAKTE